MATKAKELAVWVDCPGVTNEGRAAHSMRDACWNCDPWWERYPTCSRGHGKLTHRGFCRVCRRHYDVGKEG